MGCGSRRCTGSAEAASGRMNDVKKMLKSYFQIDEKEYNYGLFYEK